MINNDNKEYYPTPIDLLERMFMGIDSRKIDKVLEPSAGEGGMADYIVSKFKVYGRDNKLDLDLVELDANLTHVLKGKKYKVVHDDFLTYNTYKRYELIAMNPPFSDGDKHLLKAIEMQKNGGKIVCILNAETIRNPFSNNRKDLVRKLEEFGADVEYIQDGFVSAERKTNVEIALIKLDIPYKNEPSVILDHLKKVDVGYGKLDDQGEIIDGDVDWLKGIVQQYSCEVSAGVKLINEFYSLQPRFSNAFGGDLGGSILELGVVRDRNYSVEGGFSNNRYDLINEYIRQVRYKYWTAFLQYKDISSMLTKKLSDMYQSKLGDLAEYDFSLFNIYAIRLDLHKDMSGGIEECIVELFDYLSCQYSYTDEFSKNIHLFNGWKTNKSWYINKKVIVPLSAWSRTLGSYTPDYLLANKLLDIERSLNYLAYGTTGGRKDSIKLMDRLKLASDSGESKNIELNYFNVTFFKKGTCHIEFKDLELLKKLNIFGSQQKKWLPPAYGKAKYKDMSKEEQRVVDDFEGEKGYSRTMQDPKYYIYNPSDVLQLSCE
jgi:hypothetical protein